MDALIEAFGSYSIGYVVVLVAAFIFLYKIYFPRLHLLIPDARLFSPFLKNS